MWEAAPNAVSQSPKPQSHAARASDGRVSSNFLTRSRSKCATVTISRTSSGGCAGKMSLTIMRSFSGSEVSVPGSAADSLVVATGKPIEAILSRLRRDRGFNIEAPSLACSYPSSLVITRNNGEPDENKQVSSQFLKHRKSLGATHERIQRLADGNEAARPGSADIRAENSLAILLAASDSKLSESTNGRSIRTTQMCVWSDRRM